MHEGKRYSHILNPKTGIPCSGLRAVSISANLCTVVASVATIAMLKEESEVPAWLRELFTFRHHELKLTDNEEFANQACHQDSNAEF